MARQNKIWWYKERKCFYVNINSKRHRLDPDRKKAEKMFHKLKSQEPQEVEPDSVGEVLDAFIGWNYENRAKRTADRYKDFCQEFVFDICKETRVEHRDMLVSELSPRHVSQWLSTKPQWNNTTKHNAIGALIRAFNWGIRNHGIKRNPLQGMEKPKPNRRTDILAPGEFESIIGHYEEGDPFRDLVTVSYDTGCRPQEIKLLEARHVEVKKLRAVIRSEEGKGKIQRAIYFTDRSLPIVERLMAERPTGLLFVNAKGTPWNAFNIRCRFQRLEKHVGKRFYHYMFRHTSITRRLSNGVDSHIVAKLHGHKNTQMLDNVYSHIADDYEFMAKQARKGEDVSASDGDEDEKKPAKKNGKKKHKRKRPPQ